MSAKPRGKRLVGLAPGDSVADAARRTLDVRLRDVERLLDEATGRGSGNAKTIHRLRVSTRRAAAALRVFKAWVPKRVRRDAEARLKRVRRAAGEARKCDVQSGQFRSMLETSEAATLGPAIGVVIGRIVESREHAGDEVRALRDDDRCGEAALRSAHEALLASIGKDGAKASRAGRAGQSLMDLAAKQLPEIVGTMEEAGHADLKVVDNVHALRILGKRLRYATEIFECCFEPSAHQDLLRRLTDFQDHLGEMNDLFEMGQRVEAYASDPALAGEIGQGLGLLRQALGEKFAQAHQAFLEWWGRCGVESILSGLAIPGRPVVRAANHCNSHGDGDGDGDGPRPEPDRIVESTARHTA